MNTPTPAKRICRGHARRDRPVRAAHVARARAALEPQEGPFSARLRAWRAGWPATFTAGGTRLAGPTPELGEMLRVSAAANMYEVGLSQRRRRWLRDRGPSIPTARTR